jgi:hypothetical protein
MQRGLPYGSFCLQNVVVAVAHRLQNNLLGEQTGRPRSQELGQSR